MFKPGKTTVGFIVGAIILVFVLEFRAGSGNPPTRSLRVRLEYAAIASTQDYYAAYGLIVPRGIQPKYSAHQLRRRF